MVGKPPFFTATALGMKDQEQRQWWETCLWSVFFRKVRLGRPRFGFEGPYLCVVSVRLCVSLRACCGHAYISKLFHLH